ncbi:MAG: formate dehydrogenase accessory protein FdhE [Solidesulfovibrio sp.]|uniref:formate dehydrogenase accessory protein FdhE domain-containing protein n=1 Tax=Solidesulfovibrio sp. TaxID=2910990 RepID=UPI002B1FEC1E|nr:formate dehydrogenase accessory protein FdhE [Solidesulfovibrio sp.]MEA4856486.1 formate dehydrogenase accessory protein FdhE [Solidesulfovibrio sp.]
MDATTASLAEDVGRLRRERPHVRAFVDPFLGLLFARAPLVDVLRCAGASLPGPRPDPMRLSQGACLEPRDELAVLPADLERAVEVLQPAISSGFREVRPDLAAIGRAALADAAFAARVVGETLRDRRRAVAALAHPLGVDERVLAFWGVQLATPLAMARGRRLGPLVAEAAWNRGYCPVCGAWPGHARRDGGGVRMICSSCATAWRFSRPECPFCEAPGPSAQVYAVPGFDGERVVACRRCNHYLAELVEDALADYAPEVAGLALAPLELLARQHGHIPAVLDWRQMPWA